MRLEWSEAKREENLRKHGIDFVGVDAVFEGTTLTMEDDRFSYGEQRFVTFGLLEGRIVAVVHTERGSTLRIISVRKASRREEESYYAALAD